MAIKEYTVKELARELGWEERETRRRLLALGLSPVRKGKRGLGYYAPRTLRALRFAEEQVRAGVVAPDWPSYLGLEHTLREALLGGEDTPPVVAAPSAEEDSWERVAQRLGACEVQLGRIHERIDDLAWHLQRIEQQRADAVHAMRLLVESLSRLEDAVGKPLGLEELRMGRRITGPLKSP